MHTYSNRYFGQSPARTKTDSMFSDLSVKDHLPAAYVDPKRMEAYKLPSRVGNTLVYPKMHSDKTTEEITA